MTDGLITSNFRPKRHRNQDVYKYRIVAEDTVPSFSVGYPTTAKKFPGKHAYYREGGAAKQDWTKI